MLSARLSDRSEIDLDIVACTDFIRKEKNPDLEDGGHELDDSDGSVGTSGVLREPSRVCGGSVIKLLENTREPCGADASLRSILSTGRCEGEASNSEELGVRIFGSNNLVVCLMKVAIAR